MELQFEDGSKIPIQSTSKTQLGRELGLGFAPKSTDRTISRRHLSLQLIEDPTDKFRLQFEVFGKNPIWVCSASDGKCRIYKKLEKGELRAGDKLSLSIKSPSFFVVKRREGENEEGEEERKALDAVERREKVKRLKEKVSEGEEDEEIGCIDVSRVDPVKEFGFLAKGHEFDQYLRKTITNIRSWNWFLEEASDDNDDENMDGSASSKGRRTRKKKGRDSDDEDWTGESEEDKVAAIKEASTKCRPKYSTRAKDPKRPRNDASGTSKKDAKALEDVVGEEDEEDGTLGGFIVDEEEEQEEEDDEESEEEFEVDEEEDEYR